MRSSFLPVILLCLHFFSNTAHATTWHILPDGTGDAPTIQAGLDSAITGDTVFAAEGEYYETLFWPFRNGIVLTGSGMDNTIVVGDQVEVALYIAGALPLDSNLRLDRVVRPESLKSGKLALAVPIDSTTVIRNIRFRNGKDAGVVLYSASPIFDSCAVDSTRNGPGVHCLNGSSAIIRNSVIANNMATGIEILNCSLVVLDGNMFIANDSQDDCGGIICRYSDATITNNLITGNSGQYGGGIRCFQASAIIANNTLVGNSATSFGGGIYCSGSSSEIVSNIIVENSAWQGGGLNCYDGFPLISNNHIMKNSAGEGAGIWLSSSAEVSNNTIESNSASLKGGGMFCTGRDPILSDNVIIGNTAVEGGGVYCQGSPDTMSGNNIIGNSATDGGGIYCRSGSPTIIHNSIIRNQAQGNGGALYCALNSSASLSFNTLTENNALGFGDAVYTIESAPAISSSNVTSNGWGIHNASHANIPNTQSSWWGDSSGPWHSGGNSAGQGDSLSTYAWDFIPWLADADTTAPPIPPIALVAALLPTVGDTCSLDLDWEPVPLGDLAGYRVYYDTDTTGFPYADTVDVGNQTSHTLGNLECGLTYYLAVTCYDNEGNESWYSAEESVAVVSTAVPDGHTPDLAFRLLANHPNPFNPTTTIHFTLPKPGRAILSVYDPTGREVAVLADAEYDAGAFTEAWDGRSDSGREVSSGIYFYRLQTSDFTATRKMVLLR